MWSYDPPGRKHKIEFGDAAAFTTALQPNPALNPWLKTIREKTTRLRDDIIEGLGTI